MDTIELIKVILRRWKFILKVSGVFFILGVIVVLISPVEYTSSSVVIPQGSEGKSKLGGLAALAGIQLGESSTELQPVLYPNILNSTPFKEELLRSPIKISDSGLTLTLDEFIETYQKPSVLDRILKYSIGLPGLLMRSFQDEPITIVGDSTENIYAISRNQKKKMKFLDDHIMIIVSGDLGNVEINASLVEPFASAQLANNVMKILQKYIVEFKIKKAEDEYKFLNDRFQQQEKEFQQVKGELANFRDRNKNIISAVVQNRMDELQTEYNFSFSLYSELAQQLENARFQVAKDTPVFTILEPVTIPTEKSKPQKILIMISFIFIGIIVGSAYVLYKKYIKRLF